MLAAVVLLLLALLEGSYNTIYVGAILDIDPCCSLVSQLIGDIDEIAIWRK